MIEKPDKIYLDNTDFSYGLNMSGEEMVTKRETYVNAQLGTVHESRFPENGDVLVNGKYLFEVGGRS